jgi:hypothetical protein
LPHTEHEPFNPGRAYGEITKHWVDTKDEATLNSAMQSIAAKQNIIKHCVEMVPWEITRALANATMQAGYRNLFLYRTHALSRLLSLHFAQKTGVWGPGMKKNLGEENLTDPIPIEQLVKHEEKCVRRLNKLWHHLIEHDQKPQALSYEEIYRDIPQRAEAKLLPVLAALGLSKGKSDDQSFIMNVIGKGDQGTRDKYNAIPGVPELEAALLNVHVFKPDVPNNSTLNITNFELPNWIIKAQIDSQPSSIQDGQHFDLGGIIVLTSEAPKSITLRLVTGKEQSEIQWGIASPKMAKQFPESPQSNKARFKTGTQCFSNQLHMEIFLTGGSEKQFHLFTITSA